MPFIGNPIDTQNTFQSLAGKRFNGDGSTTAFTLDIAPSSTLDIEVFVGNVRQDPNSAYTLSGTTLTFTGAPPSGTNNIYVVHQAKSVGTINAPANSITSDQLNTALLTGATDIGAGIADADLLLVDDGAGGTLRKTAASRIKTYVGDNTPAWHAFLSSSQNVSTGTNTVINFDTEVVDTDSAYNTSNGRFTVPSGEGGKYYVYAQCMRNNFFGSRYLVKIRVNDTQKISAEDRNTDSGGTTFQTVQVAGILDLSAGDYVNVSLFQDSGDSSGANGGSSSQSHFMGFKLIGV